MSNDKRSWFAVEVCYDKDGELKRFKYMNCDAKMVRKLRFTIIEEGLQVIRDSKTWDIIFPWNIRSMTVHLQKAFFFEEHSDLNQTVFSKEQKVS